MWHSRREGEAGTEEQALSARESKSDKPGEARSRGRSLTLVFGALVLLVAGFATYLRLQPKLTAVDTAQRPVLTPAPHGPSTSSSAGPINSGKGVWVKSYDKAGRLASQFRTVRYDPQSDNTIHVTAPEAQFFLAHDQLLRLTGREGVVVTQQEPGGASFGKAPTAMPTKGRLEDVKLELFDGAEATKLLNNAPAHPMLTVTMNNAVFDSNTYRVYTDDYVEDGKTIAGADVPVTLTGDDYNFHGWGLLIRWNERNNQLELLEVARGDYLTIKHPQSLGSMGLGKETADGQGHRNTRASAAVPTAATGLALASANAVAADPQSDQRAPTPGEAALHSALPTPAHSAKAQPTYRADFNRHVRITQGDVELATADAMQVDFLMQSSKEDDRDKATSRPVRRSAARPSTKPSIGSDESHAPAVSQPAATTNPADQPIVVKWSGKLRVTPVAPADDPHLTPGQAQVKLFGAPVVLKQAGSALQSAVALFRTSDSSLLLTSTPKIPVLMRDAGGATVTTQTLYFRQKDRIAELTGKGEARGLIQSDTNQTSAPRPARAGRKGHPTTAPEAANKAQEPIDARWTDKATIYFNGASQDNMTIREALLEGSVSVSHPRLHLQAEVLDLIFSNDPGEGRVLAPAPSGAINATSQGALRHVFARGDVRARSVNAAGAVQHIQSDRLAVTMTPDVDGEITPAFFGAEGHVRASDEARKQSLECDWLTASMKSRNGRTTRIADRSDETDAVGLATLLAGGAVSVSDDDGRASGSHLEIQMKGDLPLVTLKGKPAMIADAASRLSGPVVIYDPASQHAAVRGAGTLHAMQRTSQGRPARPMEASWTQGVEVNGQTHRIEITGDVKTHSIDADGAKQSASGQRLTLFLSPRESAATRPGDDENNFLADQTVSAALFEGGSTLESLWNGPAGQVLRRVYLTSPTVRYSIIDQRLDVLQAGRMLVEDHRPALPPSDAPKVPADQTPDVRGVTAFKWSKRLTFDQSRHEATMQGDVLIVHEPPAGEADRAFQLRAQRVTAELLPTADHTAASTKPSPPQEARVQLKRITAEGVVHVESGANQIDAQSIAYDPTTGLLQAAGNDASPVRLTGAPGGAHGSFSKLVYDLKQDRIVSMTEAQFTGHP